MKEVSALCPIATITVSASTLYSVPLISLAVFRPVRSNSPSSMRIISIPVTLHITDNPDRGCQEMEYGSLFFCGLDFFFHGRHIVLFTAVIGCTSDPFRTATRAESTAELPPPTTAIVFYPLVWVPRLTSLKNSMAS